MPPIASPTPATVFDWVLRIAQLLVPPIVAIIAWFLTLTWNRIEQLEISVEAVKIEQAGARAGSMSSSEWIAAKRSIDEYSLSLDRRVARLEEALPVIKESLVRIENKLERR